MRYAGVGEVHAAVSLNWAAAQGLLAATAEPSTTQRTHSPVPNRPQGLLGAI